MPVYEYKCGSGHNYEKTEGFDAPHEQACPLCGTMARRQISLPAVIFKGPGFYSTDNRSSSRGGNGRSADTDTSTSSGDGHGHSPGESGHSHDDSKAGAAASD